MAQSFPSHQSHRENATEQFSNWLAGMAKLRPDSNKVSQILPEPTSASRSRPDPERTARLWFWRLSEAGILY
jgi:hypothetical protein